MAERKVFHDSVVPLPDQPGLTAAGVFQHESKPDDTERMAVEFVLGPSQEHLDALEAKVAEGQVVAPEELKGLDVPEASVSALTSWLETQGYDVDHVNDDGTAVYASATVKVIESSLAVGIVKVTKDGMTYASAKDAPSLPGDVAGDVRAIIGLQPHRQLRKHLRQGVLAPAATGQGTPASRPHGYLVSDILGAYGAAGVKATGAGQTIAILIDTLPDDGDLQAFWAANGIPGDLGRITKINVGSGPLPELSGEESLDVQWASGIAPGAKIRIYASGALTFPALDRALDAIVADATKDPGLRQLSISLGLGETFFGTASDEFKTQHVKFLKLAALGVNVFVSSGDAGSNPDATGHSATGPTQVEYESSDPAVVAVGGTTLHLKADGTVAGETGWSGSGGGKSLVFARPPWQKGPSVLPGPQRLVPDISLAADPHTGGMVVLNGRRQAVGGTSWSAPVWAGFCARINEARQKAGKPALGFLNPRLYPLAGTAAVRDITSGSNGAFSGRPGYDMVTGLGTPNLEKLISALA